MANMPAATTADGICRPPLVVCSDRLTDADGRSHRKSHDHNREHVHDLAADRDSGRICHAFKLSYNKKIRHSVKRL